MQFIIKVVVIQNPSLLTVTLGKFREFHGHFFKRVYEFLSLVSGSTDAKALELLEILPAVRQWFFLY